MSFFSDLFNSIINPDNGVGMGPNSNEVGIGPSSNGIGSSATPIPKLVGPNESCIKRKFKPNFLEQGRTLHREQLQRSDALRTNIRDMNDNVIEGFSEWTSSKNSSQMTDTTTYSNDFDKNIERYNKEYPIFIDETRNAVKLNNRNIKDNPILFKNGLNNMYDITFEKEGCYKSAGASGLELQSGMNDVNGQTCSTRAFDLGYSGFAISKGPGAQNSCALSKDILQAKGGGIATKPITSFSFKTSVTANVGELLRNGQIGIYNYNIDNNLVTDLPGTEGCDIKSSGSLINDNSMVATWGGNCRRNINFITNPEINKCIDQKYGSTPGLQMEMWDCDPYRSQQNIKYNIDTQTINVPGNNLCLDAAGNGNYNGTPVIQATCTGADNQKWIYGDGKSLRPANAPNVYLSFSGGNTSNGTKLMLWQRGDGRNWNEEWDITRNGSFIPPVGS